MAKGSSYYSLDDLLKKAPDAYYYVIFGERSNGKTFSVKEYALKQYLAGKGSFALIRRYAESFKGARSGIFNDMINNPSRGNIVQTMSKGRYNSVIYRGRKWFLARLDNDGEIEETDAQPFCYGFALTENEHTKGSSFPSVTTILFDEFLTRDNYLENEFVTFSNCLSTIIRDRNNVKIFMLGNSVNRYSPYFSEMGLTHVKDMQQGDIDIYKIGDKGLKIAVNYCDKPASGKASDVYFSFKNAKLQMITSGAWEIGSYPHLPVKYNKGDIVYLFFIQFDNEKLQGDVVQRGNDYFAFIHRKTGEIKVGDEFLFYGTEASSKGNYSRNLRKPINRPQKKVFDLFVQDKVFYQDNEVGEIVRNYYNWCGNFRLGV